MFPMVTGFMNYGQQTIRAARAFSRSNHFEFDKCIACEVCVRVCPIDLPVVDWRLERDIQKKQLLNYKYELSTYDRHELNYNQIALGRLPISIIGDYTIQTVRNSTPIQIDKENSFDSRTITNY
ncbi:hypothetical protein LUZ62_000284 [Rhynchospora pubera]|uniref:4Fe-4S ferredoxin-type domain-containing protein n=1 Tax=Rhynchospora pubera TaxID=906938 RepID=A0AAV8BJ31_9POAL|nr:hypothetical protein LUZ62_000284 [Rhynchospora pubera]